MNPPVATAQPAGRRRERRRLARVERRLGSAASSPTFLGGSTAEMRWEIPDAGAGIAALPSRKVGLLAALPSRLKRQSVNVQSSIDDVRCQVRDVLLHGDWPDLERTRRKR